MGHEGADDRTDRRRRAWALVVFAVVVVAQVGYVLVNQGVPAGPPLEHTPRVERTEVLGVLITAALGLVLCWLRPRNAVGWLVSLSGASLVLCDLGQSYGARAFALPEDGLPLGALALSLSAPLWIGTVFIPVSVLLVRYPTGVVVGRWTKRFDKAAWAAFALIYVGYAGSDGAVSDEVTGGESPIHLPELVGGPMVILGGILLLGATALILGSSIVRARRSDPRERAALLLLLVTALVSALLIFFGSNEVLGTVSYLGVLVAIAVGVLRYNALGIEIVVRRTLLYVALTGLVLVAFVGVTAGLALLVPAGPTPQLIAAALIAVGLMPARERLQQLVDRLLYGEREDPAVTLRRLGDSMGSTPSEGLLVAVTANLTEALRLDGAEVVSSEGDVVATWGRPDRTTALPLTFAGEALGELRVGTRRGEPLTRADRTLLDTVTPLIAAVVHAVALADDLAEERNRVLAATDTERSRLRQELHDGLGPSLTGIGLGLEAAQSGALADDPRAAALLARLRSEVTAALEETRRIIDDLRPVSLDDTDLVTAIRRRSHAAGASGLTVTVLVPRSLPRLAPDLETAAFRIFEEALTNVVRHARASHCQVRLEADDALRLTVEDDGIGLQGSPTDAGVGLWSMGDRAERLGGTVVLTPLEPGTRVEAVLPLHAVARRAPDTPRTPA